MAFLDFIPKGVESLWNWGQQHPTADLPHGEEDRTRLQGYLDQGQGPYMGGSPYAGGFSALVKQLQDRAAGNGPSIAGDAWNAANQQAMSTQMGMATGGRSAGAARQAATNIGNIQGGMATGYASARNQEMIGAQGALQGALTAGDQADFNRQRANQTAWLDVLAQQLGLTKAQLQGIMAGMSQPNNLQQVGGIAKSVGMGAGMGG